VQFLLLSLLLFVQLLLLPLLLLFEVFFEEDLRDLVRA
jgi:hypothetical protein